MRDRIPKKAHEIRTDPSQAASSRLAVESGGFKVPF
jgi:hypothetical protein